jgi:hypothetical protein
MSILRPKSGNPPPP